MLRPPACALSIFLCFTPVAASAKGSPARACANVIAQGRPPAITKTSQTRLLCYRANAVMRSAQTRTLWEYLTRKAVDAARELPRDSDWLPANERASLADYVATKMATKHKGARARILLDGATRLFGKSDPFFCELSGKTV